MMPERMLPENPLEFIRQCITQRKIYWTYHVNMRLKDRFIPREAIVESIADFEIIEEYPEDKYLPSCLVYSQYRDIIFHIVIAVDMQGDNVRIVTAYRQRPENRKKDTHSRRYLLMKCHVAASNMDSLTTDL